MRDLTGASEKEIIIELIEEAYIGGAYNFDNTSAMDKGFHESFTAQLLRGGQFEIKNMQDWKKELDAWKSARSNWNNRTRADITIIALTRDAAIAKVDLAVNDQGRHIDLFQWIATRISGVDVWVGDEHIKDSPIGARIDGQDGLHHGRHLGFVLGRQIKPLRQSFFGGVLGY